MKNNFLLSTQLVFISLFANLITISAQIELDCDGNVGIGTAPSTYQIQISGDTRVTGSPAVSSLIIDDGGGYYGPAIYPSGNNACNIGTSSHAFAHIYYYELHDQSSDSTFKENIHDLENALDIVMGLRCVRYDYKSSAFFDSNLEISPELDNERKNKIGFIGQQMENVLPEAVSVDDSTGIYTTNYIRVIPVLARAIQEQQAVINYLITEVESLKSGEQLKNAGTNSIADRYENTGTSSLAQNLPNPFTESTTIEYFLSENVNDAKIYIYNMNGAQLKSYDLHLKGNRSIIINGGEFNPGMYMYTLIIDGQVIDTKRMILTD